MATMYAALVATSVVTLPGAFRVQNALGGASATQKLALRSSFNGERVPLALQRSEKALGSSRNNGGLCCSATLSEFAPLTAAVYGASLLGGGLYAYTRTGSTGSLGGGVTGGVALGVAYFLMQVPETRDLGEAVAFGAAVLFAAIFGIRFTSTRKPIPAVPLLGLSAASSLVFALSYLQTRVLLP